MVYRFAEGGSVRLHLLASAGKEPTRRDYVDSSPESRPTEERMLDYELGYQGEFNRFTLGANFYYMQYRDQLILTGAVNDVGGYVRENVPDSYRAGIELQAGVQLSSNFNWNGNITFSRNKIDQFERFLDDYDEGGQQVQVYEDVDIAFSPSVISNSIFSYQWGGLTSEWVSKYVGQQFLDNTQTDSRSIDAYWINDLRFSYEKSDLPLFGNLTVSVQINNLFDEKYVSNGYTFGYILDGEQNFNYYYPQAGRNVLANLKVRF